ncbi:MAG TPA: SDR family NAD(P)-dependent oxidoreductase, partial [Burkholderiales bacterium]|nr:SDR family NAD(P)-dependent oxidoreductase [Burkholderiales bacterium]
MNIDLSGKRVVVCGGSRGIGRSIALGFAEAGAGVSICARGSDGLESVRAEVTKLGNAAHTARCDLASKADIDHYIPQAAKALGGIDVLINNASGFGLGNDEAAWQAGLDVDLM